MVLLYTLFNHYFVGFDIHISQIMALNLLAKICLATLLFGSTESSASVKSGVDIHIKKEIENGTLMDTTSDCDDPSTPNSSVPACSLPLTYCDNGTCKCADTTVTLCLPSGQALVHAGLCVTYDETQVLTQLGHCMYRGYKHNLTLLQYYLLPSNVSELNDYKCGPYNRAGMLCGKCKDGYYPLVNSLDMNCVKCPNGWSNLWKFVMVVFIPPTVFYFIILLFRVNVTSSQLHGFIFCCQGMALAGLLRDELLFTIDRKNSEMAIRVFGALYGIWNLDFLRSVNLGICLPVDTLTALSLDLAVGVYPLLLILVTYILVKLHDRNFTPLVTVWRPFATFVGLFRKNWDIKTSLIEAFMTFFYLSSIKFMSVSFDLLAPVHVTQLDSMGNITESWHVYYDATVPYLHMKHIPYAVLALCVLTLFIILPTLVLLLYPFACFQKVLNTLPIRQHVLHTFMDSFLGCYKDGTQPDTRDCRWFASFLFCFRFVLLIIGAIIQSVPFFKFSSMVVVLCVIFMTVVQPFKKESKHLYTNSVFMLLLAMLYILSLTINNHLIEQPPYVYYTNAVAVLTTVVAVLPLLYLSALIVHWLYSHRRFSGELVRALQAWRHGYQTLV